MISGGGGVGRRDNWESQFSNFVCALWAYDEIADLVSTLTFPNVVVFFSGVSH